MEEIKKEPEIKNNSAVYMTSGQRIEEFKAALENYQSLKGKI